MVDDGSVVDFSAVIPAYNREKTVARAVESALAQTWPPREVIVVDDGSRDGTARAVREFGERVRLIEQENGGAAVARNAGLRAATSTWVAFLDSDDYWTPRHLEHVAGAIRATGGRARFYFADTRRPPCEGAVSQYARAGFEVDGPFAITDDATDWFVRDRIPSMLQASVFHRERLLEAGGLWEHLRMRDDSHLFLKLGIRGSACAVNHLGTVMTADDDSGQRLTTAVGPRTARYWEYGVDLWRDLLARFPDLEPRHRRTLRRRLAVSHVRRAVVARKLGDRRTWWAQIGRALVADPGYLVAAMLPGERARR